MAFQSTVSVLQGFGVPGEMFTDSPSTVLPYRIVSGSAANNIIGATACTITSEGLVAAGGTGVFAGILVDPKDIALYGVGNIPLSPTLVVPNNTQVECMTMGTIIVTLPAAAAIGDLVVFTQSTGRLSTITPGSNLAVGTSFANAIVTEFTQGIAGSALAVITVDPTYVIPVLA